MKLKHVIKGFVYAAVFGPYAPLATAIDVAGEIIAYRKRFKEPQPHHYTPSEQDEISTLSDKEEWTSEEHYRVASLVVQGMMKARKK